MRDLLDKLTLVENKNQYLQMLKPLEDIILELSSSGYNDLTIKELEPSKILKKYMSDLKRQDKIVWALTWYRLDYIRNVYENLHERAVLDTGGATHEHSDYPLLSKVEKTFNKWYNTILSKANMTQGEFLVELRIFEYNFLPHHMGHMVSMMDRIPKMNDFVWHMSLQPSELKNSLVQIEDEWKESRRGLIEPEPEDEIIIDYGHAAWFLLPREYCDTEAEAMGHCGNAGDPRPGDRILSFREKKGELWYPHLTFILDENDYLGEMKGRGNKKPVEKYHSYIIDLLLSHYVDGIKGGGYLPENNFSLNDLTEEQREFIATRKPDIAPLETIFSVYGTRDGKYEEQLIKRYRRISPEIAIGFNPRIETTHGIRTKKEFVYFTLREHLARFGRQSPSIKQSGLWELIEKFLEEFNARSVFKLFDVLDSAFNQEYTGQVDFYGFLEKVMGNRFYKLDSYLRSNLGDDYQDEWIEDAVARRGNGQLEKLVTELVDLVNYSYQSAFNDAIYKHTEEFLIDAFELHEHLISPLPGLYIHVSVSRKEDDFIISSPIEDAGIFYDSHMENDTNNGGMVDLLLDAIYDVVYDNIQEFEFTNDDVSNIEIDIDTAKDYFIGNAKETTYLSQLLTERKKK